MSTRNIYIESKVTLDVGGPYSGEYMGRCAAATNKCGYLGKCLFSTLVTVDPDQAAQYAWNGFTRGGVCW
jgi:hypothetical protein